MNRIKLLTAAAGIATAIGIASPAVAQYPYGYNNYGYNNNGANVVGSIINGVLGYGRYPYGNYGYGQQSYMGGQVAINQCAQAAQRLSGYNRGYNGGGYNPYGGYAVRSQGQVLGIDRVQMRGYGRLKVTGVATSGRNYSNPWGYGGYAYNRSYGVPDLRFSCNADISGRVYNVNIRPNAYRR